MLNAVASTPVDELAQGVTRDADGNSVTDTPHQKNAQATWLHADEQINRTSWWVDLLEQAIEAKG